MTQEQREQALSRPEARVKPGASILDATSGNRFIWKTKDSPHVLFIDIEEDLEFQPDRILDCTNTDFPNEQFSIIFFDPPHDYGVKKNSRKFTTPSKKVADEKWGHHRRYPPYYGWDKYQTKTGLLSFIHKAQKEFHRILKDDGVLFFKWCEIRLPLNNVLPFFKTWKEMMRFYIGHYSQDSEAQTYWVMFMKTHGPRDLELSDFVLVPPIRRQEE